MDYIFKPFLPKNQLHILAGSSGVGKTTFLFQILDQIRQEQLATFAYFSSNRSNETHHELFERLNIEPFPIFSAIDIIADRILKNKPRQPNWIKLVEAYLSTLSSSPDLLVFDPGLFVLGSPKKATYWAAWCRAFNKTIIFALHPTSKPRKSQDPTNITNHISRCNLLDLASTKALILNKFEHPEGPALFLEGDHFAATTLLLRPTETGAFQLSRGAF